MRWITESTTTGVLGRLLGIGLFFVRLALALDRLAWDIMGNRYTVEDKEDD